MAGQVPEPLPLRDRGPSGHPGEDHGLRELRDSQLRPDGGCRRKGRAHARDDLAGNACRFQRRDLLSDGPEKRPEGREPLPDKAGESSLLSRSGRSEEHTSELQSPLNLVCRLLLEKKKKQITRLRRTHWAAQDEGRNKRN